MKVLTVVGARPQFIKASPVSKAIRDSGHDEIMVHTGQHYDFEMSQVFFEELGIAAPDVNLEVGSGRHGEQTAQMLQGIEEQLLTEQPDWVVIYGDTNSTLAGALAAAKLRIKLAHVEAGLRSFNRDMPEEHNRVLADHCSDLLCCPTQTAVANLAREGLSKGVELVGDTMYDVLLECQVRAQETSGVLSDLELVPGEYFLATVHRAYNTDGSAELRQAVEALGGLELPVVLPLHPRTRSRLEAFDLLPLVSSNVRIVNPVGYLDMLTLEANARAILTDSGGVQKEAFLLGVPCITMRSETEWVETVECGWNVVTGTDAQRVVEAATRTDWPVTEPPPLFGEGDAGRKIVRLLEVTA